MNTIVINRYKEVPNPVTDVNISRSSIWGNKWSTKDSKFPDVIRVGTKEEAITNYKNMLESNPSLHLELKSLIGKRLVCTCKPDPCHGDIIALKVNRLGNRKVVKEGGIDITNEELFSSLKSNESLLTESILLSHLSNNRLGFWDLAMRTLDQDLLDESDDPNTLTKIFIRILNKLLL